MIILGMDGGGTKTHALAVNERGEIIGRGVGGASGYHSLGIDNALAVIADVRKQALGDYQADAAIYCLACCDSPTDEALLMGGISPFHQGIPVACYNDSFAALRAGSSRSYGVAVICGTGFNACGIAPDGRRDKLFSLGSFTGDWGGGFSLGEAALGAAYRAYDGRGVATQLTELILGALNMPDLIALADVIAARDLRDSQVSALSPLVFQAAQAGDRIAQGIIIRLADEMAVSASAMLRRLEMSQTEVDVVLGGGVVYGQGSLLMDTVRARLAADFPCATVHRLTMPPVVGAVLLACDTLHLTLPLDYLSAEPLSMNGTS